jgi:hypothetical protein
MVAGGVVGAGAAARVTPGLGVEVVAVDAEVEVASAVVGVGATVSAARVVVVEATTVEPEARSPTVDGAHAAAARPREPATAATHRPNPAMARR